MFVCRWMFFLLFHQGHASCRMTMTSLRRKCSQGQRNNRDVSKTQGEAASDADVCTRHKAGDRWYLPWEWTCHIKCNNVCCMYITDCSPLGNPWLQYSCITSFSLLYAAKTQLLEFVSSDRESLLRLWEKCLCIQLWCSLWNMCLGRCEKIASDNQRQQENESKKWKRGKQRSKGAMEDLMTWNVTAQKQHGCIQSAEGMNTNSKTLTVRPRFVKGFISERRILRVTMTIKMNISPQY